MSTPFEIPLTPLPQRFPITIAGVAYQLTVTWNIPASCWVLDIADQTGQAILSGVPLVTASDLLEQFSYLKLGFQLYAQTDHDPILPPRFDNLGITGHLYVVVP